MAEPGSGLEKLVSIQGELLTKTKIKGGHGLKGSLSLFFSKDQDIDITIGSAFGHTWRREGIGCS